VRTASDVRISVFSGEMGFKGREEITINDAEVGIVLGEDSTVHFCEWEDFAAITLPSD